MKKISRLSITGDIPVLTIDAEEHLKGGFGLVGTSNLGARGTNKNCTKANNRAYCSNTNCKCYCTPGSN